MSAEVTARVLLAVEQIPPGRVVSYGSLGRVVGTSARRVAAALSRSGAAVPWWRVTNVRGELPASLLEQARRHWEAEGIAYLPSRCLIEDHVVDLAQLTGDYLDALSAAPECTR